MGQAIDINCDMGEIFPGSGPRQDIRLFPFITSCNIACGFHSGDPLTMERTVAGALAHQVQIGAHPSYPGTSGFGRESIQISADALRAAIRYQVSALWGIVRALGGELAYVKPHGALYNKISTDEAEATAVVEAIASLQLNLAIMGLAGSHIQSIAKAHEVPFIPEAFADRRYRKDGNLVPRSAADAVIPDPQEATDQVRAIVLDHQVHTGDGHPVPVTARSICIHGDHPEAVRILEAVHEMCKAHGIQKLAFVA